MKALGKYALDAVRPSAPEKLARMQNARVHPNVARVLAAGLGSVQGSGLQPYIPARFDQGRSSACGSHSFSAADATRRGAVAGAPAQWVASPRDMYAITRAWARAAAQPVGPEGLLTDSGIELADLDAAVATFGVEPMKGPTPDGRNSDVWSDEDIVGIPNAPPANVNVEPSLVALEFSVDPLSAAHTIDISAPDAVQVAVAALTAQHPLWGGFYCDSVFQGLGANDVAPAPNTALQGGGHAIFLADYRSSKIVVGTTEFLLVNSWGDQWAYNGTVWVSQAFFLGSWEWRIVDEKVAPLRRAA